MKRIFKRQNPSLAFGNRPDFFFRAATRASLSAPSIASEPLLLKNTRSMCDHLASFGG